MNYTTETVINLRADGRSTIRVSQTPDGMLKLGQGSSYIIFTEEDLDAIYRAVGDLTDQKTPACTPAQYAKQLGEMHVHKSAVSE